MFFVKTIPERQSPTSGRRRQRPNRFQRASDQFDLEGRVVVAVAAAEADFDHRFLEASSF